MKWSAMNLDVREQMLGLGTRDGDISPFHDWNANWGQVATLHPGESKTLITTQMWPINIPLAYQLRFALRPGGPFGPALPGAIAGLRVQLLKSIDLRSGSADEEFTLFGGQAQPSCIIICRKLSVLLTSLEGESGANVSVQVALCPVEFIDCDELTGKNEPYTATSINFIPATVATTTLAAANSRRAQLLVQNTSTNAAMIVALGSGASFTGPVGTMILPANSFGIYETPLNAYGGIVTAAWNTSSPNGGALVTEGSH